MTKLPRIQHFEDGGGADSDSGGFDATTGGGDWGSFGAFDAGAFDAGNFDIAQSLAFDAAMGGMPGVTTGPGEWGGWGSWATQDAAGNWVANDNLAGNLASFNAPNAIPVDPNAGLYGGGDWGSAGAYNATGLNVDPGVSYANTGYNTGVGDFAGYGTYGSAYGFDPSGNLGFTGGYSPDDVGGGSLGYSGGVSGGRGASDEEDTSGYTTSVSGGRDVTPADPEANEPSSWDQEPGGPDETSEPASTVSTTTSEPSEETSSESSEPASTASESTEAAESAGHGTTETEDAPSGGRGAAEAPSEEEDTPTGQDRAADEGTPGWSQANILSDQSIEDAGNLAAQNTDYTTAANMVADDLYGPQTSEPYAPSSQPDFYGWSAPSYEMQEDPGARDAPFTAPDTGRGWGQQFTDFLGNFNPISQARAEELSPDMPGAEFVGPDVMEGARGAPQGYHGPVMDVEDPSEPEEHTVQGPPPAPPEQAAPSPDEPGAPTGGPQNTPVANPSGQLGPAGPTGPTGPMGPGTGAVGGKGSGLTGGGRGPGLGPDFGPVYGPGNQLYAPSYAPAFSWAPGGREDVPGGGLGGIGSDFGASRGIDLTGPPGDIRGTESVEAQSRGPSALPAPGGIPSKGGPAAQGILSGPTGNLLSLGPPPVGQGQPGGRGIGVGTDLPMIGPGGIGSDYVTGGPQPGTQGLAEAPGEAERSEQQQSSPAIAAPQPPSTQSMMDRIASFLQNFNPISQAVARTSRAQQQARSRSQAHTNRGRQGARAAAVAAEAARGVNPRADVSVRQADMPAISTPGVNTPTNNVSRALESSRASVIADLRANPLALQQIFAHIVPEVGPLGPQALQAFLEMAINQISANRFAEARGLAPKGTFPTSIQQFLNSGFFPAATHGRSQAMMRSGEAARLAEQNSAVFDAVAKGSNVANWATGNASNTSSISGVAFGGGPQTAIYGQPGVTTPGLVEGFGIESANPGHMTWAQSTGYAGPTSLAQQGGRAAAVAARQNADVRGLWRSGAPSDAPYVSREAQLELPATAPPASLPAVETPPALPAVQPPPPALPVTPPALLDPTGRGGMGVPGHTTFTGAPSFGREGTQADYGTNYGRGPAETGPYATEESEYGANYGRGPEAVTGPYATEESEYGANYGRGPTAQTGPYQTTEAEYGANYGRGPEHVGAIAPGWPSLSVATPPPAEVFPDVATPLWSANEQQQGVTSGVFTNPGEVAAQTPHDTGAPPGTQNDVGAQTAVAAREAGAPAEVQQDVSNVAQIAENNNATPAQVADVVYQAAREAGATHEQATEIADAAREAAEAKDAQEAQDVSGKGAYPSWLTDIANATQGQPFGNPTVGNIETSPITTEPGGWTAGVNQAYGPFTAPTETFGPAGNPAITGSNLGLSPQALERAGITPPGTSLFNLGYVGQPNLGPFTGDYMSMGLNGSNQGVSSQFGADPTHGLSDFVGTPVGQTETSDYQGAPYADMGPPAAEPDTPDYQGAPYADMTPVETEMSGQRGVGSDWAASRGVDPGLAPSLQAMQPAAPNYDKAFAPVLNNMPADQRGQMQQSWGKLSNQEKADILARGPSGLIDFIFSNTGGKYSKDQITGFLNNQYAGWNYPGYPGGLSQLGRDMQTANQNAQPGPPGKASTQFQDPGRAPPDVQYAGTPGWVDPSAPPSVPAIETPPAMPGVQEPPTTAPPASPSRDFSDIYDPGPPPAALPEVTPSVPPAVAPPPTPPSVPEQPSTAPPSTTPSPPAVQQAEQAARSDPQTVQQVISQNPQAVMAISQSYGVDMDTAAILLLWQLSGMGLEPWKRYPPPVFAEGGRAEKKKKEDIDDLPLETRLLLRKFHIPYDPQGTETWPKAPAPDYPGRYAGIGRELMRQTREAELASRADAVPRELSRMGVRINPQNWDNFIANTPRSTNIEDRRFYDPTKTDETMGAGFEEGGRAVHFRGPSTYGTPWGD